MNRDNVTPFRPRPKPPRPKFEWRGKGGLILLAYLMTLVAFAIAWGGGQWLSLVGFGIAIAVVAICATRRDIGGWLGTHFEFALRTVVIAGSAMILLSLARFFGPVVGYIELAVLAWVAFRCAAGLFRALRRVPHNDPTGFLV
jgi:uncharacterized membrane protein